MSAPFAPGDVVVCVDASRTLFHAGESSRTAIRGGSVHRVTAALVCFDGPAVLIDGEKPHTCACCFGATGWASERFRKIEAPDTEIARQIRACKPARRVQPA